MDTESQVVWPLIGGLMVIVALIGLIEEDVLPGALRQWLMLGVVLLGFGLLLTWEIRRRLATRTSSLTRTRQAEQQVHLSNAKSADSPNA